MDQKEKIIKKIKYLAARCGIRENDLLAQRTLTEAKLDTLTAEELEALLADIQQGDYELFTTLQNRLNKG